MKIDETIVSENDFVNLHGHSTYSVGDAIGHPNEIIKSAIDNGMNSIAITDHGNLSVVGQYYLDYKKIKNKYNFKPIFGMEAYFHPDLNLWKKQYEAHHNKQDASLITEENMNDDIFMSLDESSENEEDKLIVENEVESKKYSKNPLNRRHHLVLLAQNNQGLNNLFKLNSLAQKEGKYRYPRIDYNWLNKYNAGIVCTSACLAGICSYTMFEGIANNWSEEKTQNEIEKYVMRFDEIFNRDKNGTPRFFLEIQFNKVLIDGNFAQQMINKYLVNIHRKTKIPLIAAADFHYPKRELWKARDIIKITSQFKGKKDKDSNRLKDNINQLECELFPKNAREMITCYNDMDGGDYITQEELISAIKNTKYISDELITKYDMDLAPKFPNLWIDPFAVLKQKVSEALKEYFILKEFNIEQKKIYVNRVVEELALIKDKKFEKYFLTYKMITDAAKNEMLINYGRGSGAGSLVNFLLGITGIDPIQYGLRFDRFLDPNRMHVVPDMFYGIE